MKIRVSQKDVRNFAQMCLILYFKDVIGVLRRFRTLWCILSDML